jgi:hypothetical protein
MGMIRNLAKKALVATVIYAGKRVVFKVTGKALKTVAKNKADNEGRAG